MPERERSLLAKIIQRTTEMRDKAQQEAARTDTGLIIEKPDEGATKEVIVITDEPEE